MNNQFNFTFDLFETFSDLCFIVSPDGSIAEVNQTAADSLEKSKDSILNENFFNLIEKPSREKVKLLFTNVFNDNKPEKFFSKVISGKKELDINFFVSKNSDNTIFVFGRDVTEERKKEIELLRFYSVAENTVNPLQITDLQGRMVYVNSAFTTNSGYTKEELLGKPPAVFGSGKHSKKFWAKMWSTIRAGKVWVGEVENRKKNGEPFFTQLLISPILDSEGKVTAFFGIHRDLFEKRILEKQLIHTQKMESIGTLAAGVAHEVGNPLASISALVQVVQRSTDDQFVKEKLELVKNQVTRISKIIRDLVDFSRPSNYELKLTDLNQNIMEAVEITKVGTKAKNILFKVDLNEKVPLLPLVSDQIQQVFVNILLNAVDAIAEKNPNYKEAKIEIKSRVDDDNVVLTFEDDGTGISEENLAKIFEPFYTTKKEGKGTGLGLWVSYGIIKSFQGDIIVESTIGEGTKFTILLPIQP